MAKTFQHVVPVELREADDGPPMLRGVVSTRRSRCIAGGRAEVVCPVISVVWPPSGIALLGSSIEGQQLAHAVPDP